MQSQLSTRRQENRLGETEIALPVEIPIGDQQKRSPCTVRPSCEGFEPAAQVVRVWQSGEQIDIERELPGLLDFVMRGAGRAIDVLDL